MMTIYYQNGFYNDEDGGFVPASAVEISAEKYTALLEAQSQGKQIMSNQQGEPVAVERAPSAAHEWTGEGWELNADKAQELKGQQQHDMWERIKAKRAQNGQGGVYVKSVDKWFHTDDNSRMQYTFIRTLPTLPPTPWKTMDNSFTTMNKALLDELSMAMFTHEQQDFANAETHRTAMLKADNPLEYDYSTGWAAIYQPTEETSHE